MYRIIAASVALMALSACGDGNPFGDTTTDDDGDEAVVDFVIPEEVAGNLTNFAYDATNQTLSITGLQRDGDETTVSYIRKPGLDQGEYEAYTFQDDPLDEHTTVYVRQIGDVTGAVAVTGGQFGFFTGGASFDRDGSFDPIPGNQADDTGLVSYSGDYIGLSDLEGQNTDLLTVPASVVAPRPAQAAVVTGRIFINVEFETNELSGAVFDREITTGTRFDPAVSTTTTGLPSLLLSPTQLNDDGEFNSTVEIDTGTRTTVGEYAGVIGGTDSEAIAGGLYAAEHFDDVIDVTGEEEYGVFVLGRCGTNQTDHGAECTVVDPE